MALTARRNYRDGLAGGLAAIETPATPAPAAAMVSIPSVDPKNEPPPAISAAGADSEMPVTAPPLTMEIVALVAMISPDAFTTSMT